MKYVVFSFLLLLTSLTASVAAEGFSDKISFVDAKKAKQMLTQEDEFTKSWSQFDIDSRMNKTGSSKEQLFDFITQQVRSWTLEEQQKIKAIAKAVDQKIVEQQFQIDFPDHIYFIKTTGNEEGGAAGYTRSNYIVIKEELLAGEAESFQKLIIHELFHVLSRSNSDFRKQMYSVIGFTITNEIGYPESLAPFRITNPDAPQTDNFIALTVDGKSVDCMMVLFADRNYSGGGFFDYLNVGFLRLEGKHKKSIFLQDEAPVIYGMKEVSGFFEQVGKNTQYIIHPEEIMAENFVIALENKTDIPDQQIVDQVKEILRK